MHNAHYVCPKNLKDAHDKLARRANRKAAQERLNREIIQAAKYEDAYKKDKCQFFNVSFSDKKIIVSVIKSVSEMAEEGIKLHHCVFAGRYYERKQSLILSARTKDGDRLETVEVDLKSFKIAQARGLHNGSSKYHDRIVALVEANMSMIRDAAASTKKQSIS